MKVAEVKTWKALARRARQLGYQAWEIVRMAEHRLTNRKAWGPGAIQWRIEHGRPWPEQPFDEGWPDPAPGVIAMQASNVQREAQQREACEYQRAKAQQRQERAELEDLERQYGPQLDGLSRAERDALAAAVLDPGTLRLYPDRWRTQGFIRAELLSALRGQDG